MLSLAQITMEPVATHPEEFSCDPVENGEIISLELVVKDKLV